jgi:hypothetical protein
MFGVWLEVKFRAFGVTLGTQRVVGRLAMNMHGGVVWTLLSNEAAPPQGLVIVDRRGVRLVVWNVESF